MAALARLASTNDKLSVLDFGGGLGSSYRQFSAFLPEYQSLTWSIIEQSNYVECGKAEFQTSNLRFYHSVDDCLESEQPCVALLSSVLQYLEAPYRILEEIVANKIQYLIVDLTPFRQANEDLLTVQVVRPPIYRADYPCWILSENRMISFLKSHYEILLQFESTDMPGLAKFEAGYRGFFCRLRG